MSYTVCSRHSRIKAFWITHQWLGSNVLICHANKNILGGLIAASTISWFPCDFNSFTLHPTPFFHLSDLCAWLGCKATFSESCCLWRPVGCRGAPGLLTQSLNWNNGDMTETCCGSRGDFVWCVREKDLWWTHHNRHLAGHIYTCTTHICSLILWSLKSHCNVSPTLNQA